MPNYAISLLSNNPLVGLCPFNQKENAMSELIPFGSVPVNMCFELETELVYTYLKIGETTAIRLIDYHTISFPVDYLVIFSNEAPVE